RANGNGRRREVPWRVRSSERFTGNRRTLIMSNRQSTKERGMGQWYQFLIDWLTQHPQWLGLILLVAACVECLAVVGLLVPGTVLLFTLAMLAGGGVLGLGETLLLGFIGGLIGDLLSYALGRRYHQNIRSLRGLRNHPEWLARAEAYVNRYGVASLLVGRFRSEERRVGKAGRCVLGKAQ